MKLAAVFLVKVVTKLQPCKKSKTRGARRLVGLILYICVSGSLASCGLDQTLLKEAQENGNTGVKSTFGYWRNVIRNFIFDYTYRYVFFCQSFTFIITTACRIVLCFEKVKE